MRGGATAAPRSYLIGAHVYLGIHIFGNILHVPVLGHCLIFGAPSFYSYALLMPLLPLPPSDGHIEKKNFYSVDYQSPLFCRVLSSAPSPLSTSSSQLPIKPLSNSLKRVEKRPECTGLLPLHASYNFHDT